MRKPSRLGTGCEHPDLSLRIHELCHKYGVHRVRVYIVPGTQPAPSACFQHLTAREYAVSRAARECADPVCSCPALIGEYGALSISLSLGVNSWKLVREPGLAVFFRLSAGRDGDSSKHAATCPNHGVGTARQPGYTDRAVISGLLVWDV